MVGNWGGKEAYGVVVAGADCEHEVDYLFNGEFEDYKYSGESYDYEVAPEWKRQGDIWAAENNSVVSEGEAAQEFGEGGESSRYVYYPGMVRVGREYYFKGWLRRTAGGGDVYVQLAEPTYNTVYTTLKVSANSWTQVSATFKSLSDDVLIKLYCADDTPDQDNTRGLADAFKLESVKPGSRVKRFNHNIVVGDTWDGGGLRYYLTLLRITGNSLVEELKHNIIGRCRLGILVEPGVVQYSGNLDPDQSGLGPNQLRLGSGASGVDDAYVGMRLVLAEGSGVVPDEATVVDYAGSAKVATIEYPVWVNAPAGGEGYELMGGRGRIDPGAIDYNLIYAWESYWDTDGVQDGYMLNGAAPGEYSYYYGEYYGATPDNFFLDPDHELPGIQDYHIAEAAPVYSYTYRNGSYGCQGEYGELLGLDCDFVYPANNYNYWHSNFPAGPAADGVGPELVSTNPAADSYGAAANSAITLYVKDRGTGNINRGLALDGIERSSLKLTVDSAIYSYGDPQLYITPDYGNAAQYRLVYRPDSPFGVNVAVDLYAEDTLGNSLSESYMFSPIGVDGAGPQIVDFFPRPDDVCLYSQPLNIPIQFELSDAGVGVNIYSSYLSVATWENGSLLQTLYDGPIYSYSAVDNTPQYSNYTIFYRPECEYTPDLVVSVTLEAYDYEDNWLYTTRKFCLTADFVPPAEVAYFKARVSAQGVISLSWDGSVDSPLYDGQRPDACDVGDLDHYELLVCGADLEESLVCTLGDWQLWQANISNLATGTEVYDLPEGKYKFMLRGVDVAGNASLGALANRNVFRPYGEPLTLYEGYFDEAFNGLSDDFSGSHLEQWVANGGGSFSLSGGKLKASGADGELLGHNFAAGDLEYSAVVSLGANEAAYLLFRRLSGSGVGESGYVGYIDGSAAELGLYELSASGYSVLVSKAAAIGAGSYTLQVTAFGSSLSLEVSGLGSVNISDATYGFGRAGIWKPASDSSVVEYDDIVIKDYTDPFEDPSEGNGSWATVGVAGGDYVLAPGGDDQDITVEDLRLTDDFILQADITIAAEGSQGCLLFQKENEGSVVNSGYGACVKSTAGTDMLTFYRISRPTNSILATTSSRVINSNTTYHVKLLVSGEQFALYGSDTMNKPYAYERWLVAQDDGVLGTPYMDGGVGFWQENLGGAGYDVTYDNLVLGATAPFRLPGVGGTQYDVVYTSDWQTQYNNIQNTIDNAAYGDTLVFSCYTYYIGNKAIQMRTGISLLGGGPDCTVIRGKGKAVINGANEATIEGIQIRGVHKKGVGIYAANVSPMIVDCEITSCYDGVRIGGPQGTQPSIPAAMTGCASAARRGRSPASPAATFMIMRTWASAITYYRGPGSMTTASGPMG
jgi:hypothetical protein